MSNVIKSNFGRYYHDFNIGDLYKHPVSKTITESDNNLFCLLTMNHHPVHIDKEYAGTNQHKRILVVGTYVFSLVVGIAVSDITGKAIAALSYHNIDHNMPVFINDTISAESSILSKRLSKSKTDRGIVTLETNAYNQKNINVLTFRRTILVPNMEEEL